MVATGLFGYLMKKPAQSDVKDLGGFLTLNSVEKALEARASHYVRETTEAIEKSPHP